ncbi:MAG: metalloregulator ArsR/SmtB family transcription factor [Opitutales bacterium]
MMASETLRLLADSTRLRILILLVEEELSVAELQDILGMGQSRISTHLSLLRRRGLVTDRKDGKKTFYGYSSSEGPGGELVEAALRAVASDSDVRKDGMALNRIVEKRRRASEKYFDTVAGRLGKNYCPGRSWEAIGHFLLRLVPEIVVADLGAGEGMVSQLLARRAKKVYCIDSSRSMVRVGKELARKNGLTNLAYKHGDIEKVPLPDESVDLALMSQSLHHAQRPEVALAEAFRILRPEGQVIVLDLKEHTFEKARELYADRWLGFSENDLYRMLRETGFRKVSAEVVTREAEEPHFATLLASGEKAD